MVRRTLSLKTLQTVEAMHTRMQATGAGPLAQPTDPPCVGTPKENDGQTGARAWTRQCCKGGGGLEQGLGGWLCSPVEAPIGHGTQ